MASPSQPGPVAGLPVDVIVVIDTTGSMDPYLRALERLLPQLVALRALTKPVIASGDIKRHTKFIDRIGILSYSDYYLPPQLNTSTTLTSIQNPIPPNDEAEKAMRPKLKVENVIGWSGWDAGETPAGSRRLVEWVKGLTAEGGGDYPEAAKTALRQVLDLISSSAETGNGHSDGRETLVLWFTDAPPHHRSHRSLNRLLEIAAYDSSQPFVPNVDAFTSSKRLNASTPLPPVVPSEKCIDWMALCLASRSLPSSTDKAKDGEPLVQSGSIKIWTILPPTLPDSDISFWSCLGTITGGGTCIIGGPRTELNEDANMEDINEARGVGRNLKTKDKPPEVIITTGTSAFVKRVIEVSRVIVTGALGLVSMDELEKLSKDTKGKGRVAEGAMDIDNSEKSKSQLQSENEWIRLVTFRDNIMEFLPTGPPENALRPTDTDPRQISGEADNGNTKATDTTMPDPPEEADLDAMAISIADLKKVLPRPVITNEDEGSLGFLPPPWKGPQLSRSGTPLRKMVRDGMGLAALQSRLIGDAKLLRRDEVVDWALEIKKYYQKSDDTYQEVVNSVLKGVVDADVEAISLVRVFAEAWRCVTASAPNSSRDALLTEYTARVSNLKDRSEEDRQRLLNWAKINHDASSEVRKLLEEDASKAMGVDSATEKKEKSLLIMEKDVITELGLTGEGILELNRSVDKKVLKRIGNMLRYTRLVNTADSVGSRTIDISKTSPEVLFRVIPHLAVEGLLYSSRAAAISAIIAIVASIPHLISPARELLRSSRGIWLNSTTPENFTPEFTHFILSLPPSVQEIVLSDEEKVVYESMGRYSALESELMDRKVDALIPWTPMKTRGVGDRKRLCVGCGIQRSETMMVQVGTYKFKKQDAVAGDGEDRMRCGMCVDSVKDPLGFKDHGILESCWVECSERWCRAQYVIEDEEGLRIPPRCYYCRNRKACPWIECTLCTNRIILPKSYRMPSVDTSTSFICPPCQFSRPIGTSTLSSSQIPYTGHNTIVHKLTTLRSILFANEYEVGWLGIKPFREVFRGRTTFMIWELYGSSIFTPYSPSGSPSTALITSIVTPSRSSTPPTPTSPSSSQGKGKERKKRLQVNGKALLNPPEVKKELDSLVDMVLKRGNERCGLSFELMRREDGWITSCGNEGCQLRISQQAWNEWFTGDGRRKFCPSCWRLPITP